MTAAELLDVARLVRRVLDGDRYRFRSASEVRDEAQLLAGEPVELHVVGLELAQLVLRREVERVRAARGLLYRLAPAESHRRVGGWWDR